MRLFRKIGVSVFASVVIVAAIAWSPTSAARREAENVARVRTHLDSVLTELEGKRVDALTDAQRVRRHALLATLRAYRDAGSFPHNYDFPGRAVPYFRDRKTGALCAVAYLLASTGRQDIVARVAAANNNVRVPQLGGDSALSSWLNENGVTLGEAARIQVVYAQSSRSAYGDFAADVITPMAALGSLATSIDNMLGNADGHSVAVATVGTVSGLATIGGGLWLATAPSMSHAPGAAAITLGVTSVALSLRAFHRRASGDLAQLQRGAQPVAFHDFVRSSDGSDR